MSILLTRQLPVFSPLTWRALRAGLRGCIREDPPLRKAVRLELQRSLNADGVVLTDCGTSALAVAMRCAISTTRLRVALPAYGCYDLATSALAAGAEVVLYDIDPATLGPDEASLGRVLRQGVEAVVLVHQFGFPVDIGAVRSHSDSAGSLIIEDAAQALGAVWGGNPAGSFGDYTVLSFGRGKGVTAGGGGALLWRGNVGEAIDAAHLPGNGARKWVALATLAAQWIFGRPSLYWLPYNVPFFRLGETVFRAPRTPAQASSLVPHVLAVTMKLNEQETQQRRTVGQRLREQMCGIPGLVPIDIPLQALPSYLRLPFRCSRRARAAAESSRASRLGITKAYPRSLADLPQLRERRVDLQADFPGARELAETLFTMPTHRRVGERGIDQLEEWIRATARAS